MDKPLAGKTALVTGAGRGIGRAICTALAREGAAIVAVARTRDQIDGVADEIRGAGGRALAVVADVTRDDEILASVETATRELGGVDILVNNAGTARTMAFENISDEAWQEDLDLKLFAAIRFSRLVWPGMKARKWGRIINVLNTYAKAPAASSAPTSVSRAAGMALTKVMASEGGEHNILVNAMLVGLIMSDQWVQRHAKQAPEMDFEVFAKNLAKGTPLGRIGTAEEFASMACFLASEQGSYITGTAINIDGGRSPVV